MKQPLYFGTYTRRISQGIYKAIFSSDSGAIENTKLFIKEGSPTYLTWSENFIFSISNRENMGGISSYNLNGELLCQQLETGPAPCHITYDSQRQLIYTANYHTSQIKVYHVNQEGHLSLAWTENLSGNGPHPNQDKSHPHCVLLSPDRYLFVCDLGSDRILSYFIDSKGQLSLNTHYQARPGSGPRHLLFHPSHKLAYLVCELDSSVDVLIYNGVGYLEYDKTISTIPDSFTEHNAASALKISQNQQFLYVSNRGHNSITCFKIELEGSIELVGIYPSHGYTPRDFCISPDDKYLVVSHQDSDNISIFKRDTNTGHLTLVSQDHIVPESVFVDFEQNTLDFS
ncbi:lactonase family protein [Streptococcus saliviloxodontae]|uniref:6-phosphogluconolactonase n=1 Tax=Streptococcus saliviloxodontae TaxID=1349416 RepID=A0ABS2PMD6_9STRE|nr:lactonase family protein [Streptococcus saliviloxodontae]MBM7636600.1 6-phosphogluconolactonase [Streptococcus saliviloxodontae]